MNQHPCDRTNTTIVTTDATGGFDHSFAVEPCPAPKTATATSCFLGVPVPSGVDGINLIAAANISFGRLVPVAARAAAS